jgi:hypothetical protein
MSSQVRYADRASVERGLRFKTRSDLIVATTGRSMYIGTVRVYVHEVEVVEGPEAGRTFYHNLDYAGPLPA